MTWPSTAAWRRIASSRARYAQAGASGWRASTESSRATAPAARSRLAATGGCSARVLAISCIRIHERDQAVERFGGNWAQFPRSRDAEVNQKTTGRALLVRVLSFYVDLQGLRYTGTIRRIAGMTRRFATASQSGVPIRPRSVK